MSIADKLQVIAENEHRVYQAGYDKGAAEGGGAVGDDYVVEINPPNTIKTYTDNISRTVPDNKFKGFKELTTAIVPHVEQIGTRAFDGCIKLTTVRLGGAQYWIGDYAFNSCVGLNHITMNVNTDDFNLDYSGFGEYVFANCTNLEKVDLSTGGASISVGLFSKCSNLNALIIRGGWCLDLIDINAFEGTPIANGTGYIYVQSKMIEEYQPIQNWTPYISQFRILEDYTVDGTIDGELDETKI